MKRVRTGNNKFLKVYNETGILDLIRTEKALSRADISKATGLSPTATGVIVSTLMEKGYLHEVGIGASKGGRKPVLLELKPDSYYAVGLDIDVDGISYILADITGRVVSEGVKPLGSVLPDDVAAKAEECISEITAEHSIDRSKLLGVGISVPGMVDAETRSILLAPNLNWEDVDLGAMLKFRLELPVYTENEAMASAIYENWIGACQGISNFVCVNSKSGIGAGIFTGGKPYRGAGGSAGEVGHVVVDENGPKCGCGNYGCLETIASTGRIVEKARKLVRQGVVSSLNEISDVDGLNLNHIIDSARNGDEAARGLLNEAARYVGIALSNLVNTLNPSKIVLGKDFVKYGDLVMDMIRSVIDNKSLKRAAAKVEITLSEKGDDASTLGAAIIPLKVLFGR
jgi:glucokinase-like ROK family protein